MCTSRKPCPDLTCDTDDLLRGYRRREWWAGLVSNLLLLFAATCAVASVAAWLASKF